VKPIPTIPFSRLGPSNAIQCPLRIDNAGRRAAEGLFGCIAQYDSISSNAIRAGIGPIEGIFKHHVVLPSHFGKQDRPAMIVRCKDRTIRQTVDLCIGKKSYARPVEAGNAIETQEHAGEFREW
jgi:hypothetical protein